MFLVCIGAGQQAFSHEVDTHMLISAKAIEASNLAAHLADMGIAGVNSRVLPRRTAQSAHALNSLQCTEQPPKLKTNVSLENLVLLGAYCEDVTFGDSHLGEDGFRYVKHFYDPAHAGRGFMKGKFKSSRVWALEETPFIGQNYSYKDARAYYYDGLTLPAKEDRDNSLSKTFRSIGHVIHLIQDLTQPQHTREDGHGAGSLFEQYTNLVQVRTNLPFSGYAPVAVTKLNDIWDTNDLKGLANFSNMNFVTKGTNFDQPGLYAVPKLNLGRKTKMDITTLCANRVPACPNTKLTGSITFFGTDVIDRYTGSTTYNPYTSSEGFFDEELKANNYNSGFTLNRFNFELAHTYLIPRAVGYSAGLINYFFRGKLEFVQDELAPWRYIIKNLSDEPMTGRFALYYDDKEGKRHPTKNVWDLAIGANESSANLGLKPNSEDDPAPNIQGEYTLVFHGTMGNETGSVEVPVTGAVAAKKVVDPINLKFTKANYFTMGVDTPDPLYGISTEFEFDERLVDLFKAGQNKISVSYTGKETGSRIIPCKSYGTDAVYCYSFSEPSINIKFDASGKASYYKQPFFLWDAYKDTSATMTFYIDDAVLFQFSFVPEAVGDSSPIIFKPSFHTDTKDVVVGPFRGL